YWSMTIVLFFAVSLIYFGDTIYDSISVIADVIIYRYENSENLFSFLMSSRDNYVSDAFNDFFKSGIWPIKLIIGGGAFMSFRPDYYSGMIFDTLENEFFDIFFMYGLVGLVIYLGIIFYELYRIYKVSTILSFLFLLFALHSIFAGHILFDGIPIMAGLLIIMMSKNSKQAKLSFNI
ncbi:MAG: hypothetical protein K2H59_07145, partial [Muribaculaceae bacterium]|nr:hypothetical protein [Muribaculaceae bacterium]